MELTIIERQHYISLDNIQQTMNCNDTEFGQTLYYYRSAATKSLDIRDKMISCKSACHLLQWWMDKAYCLQPAANSLLHSLKKYTKKRPKRAMSRSLRIEIAFQQEYACNLCGLFPIPPTFEVDHIIELQDGGQDIAENLQAICVSCHADKTRRNRLSKNPIFQSTPKLPQDVAVFSKYFHQPSV
jgi:5-methylcytosine-specific restriction endonuclease McrA|tara:strand:- start:943 stop:1497 length:555 start_codon:yes stop_codon:yes gene_type:complete